MLSPWLGSANAIWSTETARVYHKTAGALGLTIPAQLYIFADEVIE
jgi:hypothetical protein